MSEQNHRELYYKGEISSEHGTVIFFSRFNMFMRNLRRAVKYGIYGSVAIGGTVTAVKLQDGDYDYESLAIVRITRTAVTAVDIGRTYHTMLYSKEWDRESDEYLEVKSQAHKIGAQKLLELCKANKGVYIKVGQHVGALDYLLPTEYVATMRILHKDAPKNTVNELYKVIREDLKKEPEEMFDDFEPEPLGTASLAQVHKAKLKDGTVVAVKVQHDFVRKNINIDLRWMEFVISTMSKIFPEFQLSWLVDETKKNITKELDFLQEGKNSEKAAVMFSNYKWLKVPKIFWEVSSERVLVMEYVSGGQLWLSIINRDNAEMKVHGQKLGVKPELFALFACMVTGRPWESIVSGIGSTKPTIKEKQLFQKHLPDIMHYVTQCLEQMDRQTLLVLKTNDLIRSIEYTLGTQDRMCGFLVMSKCCVQS
ncbi:putative aarF domain-containing protein kinase 1, partial [Operophtera brumata]